jgi:hypothetical protein
MRRREFIAGLSGAMAAPLTAPGQQPSLPIVGYVELAANVVGNPVIGFRKGLSDSGYAEGQNVTVAGCKLQPWRRAGELTWLARTATSLASPTCSVPLAASG